VVHGVFVLSTTCFGLYIGHHQVIIKLIKRFYNLYGVFGGGGDEISFYNIGQHEKETFE
jgi:hypothetical protein